MDLTALLKFVGEITPGGAGVWTLVVMVGAYIAREWRETRKLSLDDRVARRDGYARQVEMLLSENRSMLLDMRTLRDEYDTHRQECQAENAAIRKQWQNECDQLRSEIVRLENRLSGVFRKVADIAVRTVRGDVDQHVVSSILELATEAQAISSQRAGT